LEYGYSTKIRQWYKSDGRGRLQVFSGGGKEGEGYLVVCLKNNKHIIGKNTMEDMVPRSRLNAVDAELEEAKNKLSQIQDAARIEIERLMDERKSIHKAIYGRYIPNADLLGDINKILEERMEAMRYIVKIQDFIDNLPKGYQ
jgi:hypothetical protein